MKTEIIPKVITLLAGAIVSIVCIINGVDVTRSLEFLLATLIIFYIVGCLVKRMIQNILISNSVLRKKIDKQAEEDIDEEKKEDSPSKVIKSLNLTMKIRINNKDSGQSGRKISMDEKGKTALWEEYSQTKDPKIREKLILQYSELVKIVAVVLLCILVIQLNMMIW